METAIGEKLDEVMAKLDELISRVRHLEEHPPTPTERVRDEQWRRARQAILDALPPAAQVDPTHHGTLADPLRHHVSAHQAADEVIEVIETTTGSLRPCELAEHLRLDVMVVLEAIDILKARGWVEFEGGMVKLDDR